MSFTTWHNYGYGICIGDLKEKLDVSRVMNLIKMAPDVYNRVKDYLNIGFHNFEIELDDILVGYVEDRGFSIGGLAAILCEVIEEVEELSLYVCIDYDGKEYLIYPPSYPWELARMPQEKDLTEDRLRKIYSKYLRVVTDEDLEVKYQSVENGG